ncbi:MAG: phage tail sheath family protein [Chitinophagaceae bacterium]|nr:MAG: phage tail sheath family protein [Chitinophagaceae bacterium]
MYSLGAAGLGIGARQVPLSTGSDGVTPQAAEYDDAYDNVLDKEVDLFNLLVLPPDEDAAAVPVHQLYGSASVYCQKRRAFLLMDSPTNWTDAQVASTGVAGIRVGLVKDYSAVFFPQIIIKDNYLNKDIGPAGALAGLFARTDASRGVWKAPAGIEGDLRDVVGVKTRYSDAENGILNPRAINTIRSFPSGIVNWGARTNFGDDDTPHDYKYIPVRRTALFIEESLYRGLKWVVFEPNDEPLWAQIRLNVGAFMHNLFRQGAFQGEKKSDAYFVKCDKETTTQNDILLLWQILNLLSIQFGSIHTKILSFG